MTGPLAAPSRTTDWLAVATACLFAVNGAALIFQNETVLFRLAVLGWPAWTAVLLATRRRRRSDA